MAPVVSPFPAEKIEVQGTGRVFPPGGLHAENVQDQSWNPNTVLPLCGLVVIPRVAETMGPKARRDSSHLWERMSGDSCHLKERRDHLQTEGVASC